MLTETGRVVGIEGDGIWVETVRRSTCGTCSAQKGCGHGLLNRISEGRRGYVRALPGEQSVDDYNINDQVVISIPEEVILRGSFIAYILPIFFMLAGAIGGSHFLIGQQDLLAVAGAAGGLALGFTVVRRHGLQHRQDPAFQPTLLRIDAPALESVTISK
ncbi:MAG: SoxR reducing system RseC family protein [Halioglobus sp.]|nr:SoxR reducing system RseC family protein [Halioglobus sp.]